MKRFACFQFTFDGVNHWLVAHDWKAVIVTDRLINKGDGLFNLSVIGFVAALAIVNASCGPTRYAIPLFESRDNFFWFPVFALLCTLVILGFSCLNF